MNQIGFSRLSKTEQVLYAQFVQAFQGHALRVHSVPIDQNTDAMNVLRLALSDYPDVIYFNKTKMKVSTSLLGGTQILLEALFSPQELRKKEAELELACADAINAIEALNPMTAFDKLICIYEYLQDNIIYDNAELEACARTGRSITPTAHNAYGALVKKAGVCDGISSAFCLLAQKMGFECTVVFGKSTFEMAGFSDHAWNIVKVNDKFYHLDLTWDVNRHETANEYFYDYFLVDDDSIASDHEWDINATPVCAHGDLSFHFKMRCYANNLSQVEEIFSRCAARKQAIVRVKIAEGIAIPAPEEKYLFGMLETAATCAHRNASIEFMWNKNARCFYAKFRS